MSIEAEFRSRGEVRGGILILDAADALAMLMRAQEAGVEVLGVDGFWLSSDSTQADLGNSIDIGDGKGTIDDAMRFVEERSQSGMKFEVVLDEH